jgi:hypothetical protein
MAKLNSTNLPDWLAQWAMNRGAIENPSTSVASSGLFDQPVIRRRRPVESIDDGSDDSWMYETSPVLDSYPTSWEDVGRDLSNIPGQFMEDITEFGNSLIDGASSMFKDAGKSIEKSTEQKKETGLLGTINQLPDTIMRGLLGDTTVNFLDKVGNQGSTGSFMRGANDKTLPMSARVAGGLGAGMSLLMPGMGATGVGLFGGIANAMGFHHDFDPRYESNLSYNPESGRISWDSASHPGGGGHQYGNLNNQNFFEANPDQYFKVDGMGYMTGRDLATGAIPWEQFDQEIVSNFDDYTTDFNTNTPFGFQDFGQGDHNVTNQQALAQYNRDGTGAIQNEAGAIAERSDVGYNRQQTIANVIADFTNEGIDMDWDSTEASDFSGVGDDGLSFDWSDDDWTL